jgi:hypothetical protein
MNSGSNKKLVVDCVCGGSFTCTEKELRASLSGIRECGTLIGTAGNFKQCNRKYSYLRLLKIMQITDYWHAGDTRTYNRSDNIEIEAA